jgi:pyrroloquinoline quinone biosynthesis protein E
VLPCHLAQTLPLEFDSVRDRGLDEIWAGSPALQAFRGEAWMPEPCRSCDRRGVDYGGCRCQAYHLTGDLRATDPVCALAPDHGLIESARAQASEPSLVKLSYRTEPNSRRLGATARPGDKLRP